MCPETEPENGNTCAGSSNVPPICNYTSGAYVTYEDTDVASSCECMELIGTPPNPNQFQWSCMAVSDAPTSAPTSSATLVLSTTTMSRVVGGIVGVATIMMM